MSTLDTITDAAVRLRKFHDLCYHTSPSEDAAALQTIVDETGATLKAYRAANLALRPNAGPYCMTEEALLQTVVPSKIDDLRPPAHPEVFLFQQSILNFQEVRRHIDMLDRLVARMNDGEEVSDALFGSGAGVERHLKLSALMAFDMLLQLRDFASIRDLGPAELLCGQSPLEHNLQLYVSALQGLYGCPGLIGFTDYSPYPTCGAIRTTVEVLVRNSLGIWYFEFPSGEARPVQLTKLLQACKSAKVVSAVPWWQMVKVYGWGNLFVHYGRKPRIAEITLVSQVVHRMVRGVQQHTTDSQRGGASTQQTVFPTEKTYAEVEQSLRKTYSAESAILHTAAPRLVAEDDWPLVQLSHNSQDAGAEIDN